MQITEKSFAGRIWGNLETRLEGLLMLAYSGTGRDPQVKYMAYIVIAG